MIVDIEISLERLSRADLVLFGQEMKPRSLLVLVFAFVALGQFPSYETTTKNACEDLIALPANATGVQSSVYSSSNGLGYWKVAVSTVSSATTIEDDRELTQISPGAIANVWLDPFVDVDLTDGSNGYSACGYIFKGLPHNTILRGQDDDGSCTQMFSQKCVDAITSRAAEKAKWLVQNPTQGPFSNLTPPILSPICDDILVGIGSGPNDESNPFPAECSPFFDDGGPLFPTADTFVLTSNVMRPQNCTFEDSYDTGRVTNKVDYNVPPGVRYPFNSTNGSAVASYDELVHQVWPILTIYFPPANNSRQRQVDYSQATMTCLRAENVKTGSRIPAALPDAEAVHFPDQLSPGAIAGIVIGSVLGIAILVGTIWWCWRKRRRQSKLSDHKDDTSTGLSPHEKETKHAHQLDSKEGPVQLDSSQRAELRGADARHELANSVAPQELPGSINVSSIR